MTTVKSILRDARFDARGSLWEFEDVVEYVDDFGLSKNVKYSRFVELDANSHCVQTLGQGPSLDPLLERFRKVHPAKNPAVRVEFVWNSVVTEQGFTLWSVELVVVQRGQRIFVSTSWALTTPRGHLVHLHSSSQSEAVGELKAAVENFKPANSTTIPKR